MEEKKRDVFKEAMLFFGLETLARNGMAGVLQAIETGPETESNGAEETA